MEQLARRDAVAELAQLQQRTAEQGVEEKEVFLQRVLPLPNVSLPHVLCPLRERLPLAVLAEERNRLDLAEQKVLALQLLERRKVRAAVGKVGQPGGTQRKVIERVNVPVLNDAHVVGVPIDRLQVEEAVVVHHLLFEQRVPLQHLHEAHLHPHARQIIPVLAIAAAAAAMHAVEAVRAAVRALRPRPVTAPAPSKHMTRVLLPLVRT